MDVKSELNKVHINRLLQTQNEISEFDTALENLIKLKDSFHYWRFMYGL